MGLQGLIAGKTRVAFIVKNNTVIQFDASIKETHSRESPPTEFPVENGETISDHIIVKPFALELQGIISDTPIGGIQGLATETVSTLASALIPPVPVVGGAGGALAAAAGVAGFQAITGAKSPSVAAYLQLLSLQQNGTPFDVLTSLHRYSSMWIKSLSVPRDAETGNVLMFTVQLVQLLLVTPKSVNITIFANPSLSANLADTGEQDLVSGLQAGRTAGLATAQVGLAGG